MKTYLVLIFAVLSLTNPAANGQRAGGLVSRTMILPFSNKQNVLYLFHRICEPIFVPKENVLFKVPTEYLPERYQIIANELAERFGTGEDLQHIQVKAVSPPDLTLPLKLGRQEIFSHFVPLHRRIAANLVESFMNCENFEDFLSTAIYCRDRINPYLFVYALSVAILHRSDTQNLLLPPLSQIFPDKFLDGSVFATARTEINAVPAGSRVPIEIPRDYTATDMEPEHRIAYFREDPGLNLNHWNWHLVYPLEGSRQIVNKDRRGELFYYFHQQVIARFNFERFCNKLPRVTRLLNWFEPVEQGYFPKLNNFVASRVWPARIAYTRLRDISRRQEQIQFDISDLIRWKDRIYEAIHLGRIINEQGEVVELTEFGGIDVLGNILESSVLSPNRNFYGDLHNLGHVLIAFSHDPDGRHLESLAVMGDTTTAMRDPIFYRWHSFVDDVFTEHKNTLPRYTVQQLSFQGVRVTGLEVISENAPINEFATYWRKHDIDLSRGLDFAPRGPVFIRITLMHHAPFVYRIQVENTGAARLGMVRIFLAPKFDESGLPILFRDQRRYFIELDKFTVQLRSGVNVFRRASSNSSVTIPFEATYRNLENILNISAAEFNYCGCGWPDNLLIPKGTPEGFPAELFVMISDYAQDRVDQPAPVGCQQAHSYCGLRNRLYPDKRSMGFPFDRMPRDGVNTLQDFLTSNMIVTEVLIRHTNRVIS